MKKFIIKILFYFIPFLLCLGGYEMIGLHTSGDIGILGQIPFGEKYVNNLQQNYLQNNLTIETLATSYEKLQIANVSKIFTIGDSFSQQKVFGYQNYLAHLLHENIINIKRNGSNLETAISLLNSGIIDSTTCQIIIIENGDRSVIEGLNKIDFEMQYKLPPEKEDQGKKNTNKNSKLYNLCSCIRLHLGHDNPIFKCNLKQACFTHHYFSQKLFYYKDDMNFLNTSQTDIEIAKENLILLNKKFSEKGIKLIFLIAADKYDVYRPFMTDDSLPIDTTTNELSNIPDVCVINTKTMFQDMVKNGEKDVYMVNDTHWSYKASEAVAEKLIYVIDSFGILE